MTALAGRRVVVTRPRGRGAELARLLRSRGARVACVPLVRIQPRALAVRLRRYDWLALTSVNAVRAIGARLARLRGDRPKLAALGPATARALRGYGIRPDLVARTPTAEGLARALKQRLGGAPARVLHPTSDKARRVLRDALVRAGHRVDEAVGYLTRPVASLSAAARRRMRDADAIVVCSPSAVERLHTLRLVGARLASIGEVTARAARRRGLRVAATALRPTPRSLAAAVARALAR